jgi:hypothetical protein
VKFVITEIASRNPFNSVSLTAMAAWLQDGDLNETNVI